MRKNYKKAKQWGLKITFSHLNEQEVWVAYHKVLIPALIYPLGAIPLDETQRKKIMGPALKAMLPKLGLSATTARDPIHAVPRHGGPGIADIYTHTGTMRIKMFLGHWRENDATVDILKISMGCCQQEVEIGPNLLEKDYRKYGWILQHCWIKVLWQFLDDINGIIIIEEDWYQQRHENDIYLMNIVHDMALSKDQIRQINQCRLFKRVTFISKILHHYLHDFHPDIWDPTKQMSSNINKRFPIIEMPKQYWPLWRTVLEAVRSANRIPIRQLGSLHTKNQAQWLASQDLRYLYQQHSNEYTVHKLMIRHKNTLTYPSEPLFQTNVTEYNFLIYVTPYLYSDGIKVTYRQTTHHTSPQSVLQLVSLLQRQSSKLYNAVKMKMSQQFESITSRNIPTMSLYDDNKHQLYRQWWQWSRPSQALSYPHIESSIPIHIENRSDLDHEFVQLYQALHPSQRRNLGRIESITYLPGIIQALEQGKVIGVSDASVSADSFASHAYTIISKNEKFRIMGVAPVDCDEDDTESTRAEKSGVLAILTIVSILTDLTSTVQEPVALYCDNSEAVNLRSRPDHLRSFVRFVETNIDLDMEVETTMANAGAPIQLIHLEGHQDDQKDFDYDTAPLPVCMNIDMDMAAKQFLKSNQGKLNPTRITPFFKSSKTALRIHDTIIASNIETYIKLHKNGPPMEHRLVRKKILQQQHLQWIQCKGLERATNRLKTIHKIPATKILYDKWSTEGAIAEWYEAHEGMCLRCKLTGETQDHIYIYQCRSENVKLSYEEAIKTFRAALKRAKTVPMITDLLVQILKEHRLGYDSPPVISACNSDQTKQLARLVYHKQRDVGPKSLAKRFMIKEWEALQNVCTNSTNVASTNVEWASRVISALWSFSRQIWDGRCKHVHATNPNTNKSLKTDELLRILNKEILFIQELRSDYDTQQLITNIESKKQKAKNHTIYKWLDMLRHRKEEPQQRKQHEQRHRIRVQSITRWRDRS